MGGVDKLGSKGEGREERGRERGEREERAGKSLAQVSCLFKCLLFQLSIPLF